MRLCTVLPFPPGGRSVPDSQRVASSSSLRPWANLCSDLDRWSVAEVRPACEPSVHFHSSSGTRLPRREDVRTDHVQRPPERLPASVLAEGRHQPPDVGKAAPDDPSPVLGTSHAVTSSRLRPQRRATPAEPRMHSESMGPASRMNGVLRHQVWRLSTQPQR